MASQSPQQRVDALAARSQVLRVDAGFGELQFRYWPGPEKAPVLLLVHGGSGSWTHWVKNIVSLQRAYHLWAIDLPGLGESDTLPHGYSAEDAVQAFVLACQRHPNLKRCHVVAFSWGCAVAAQGALHLSANFQSLTLIGPASIGDVSRAGGMKPLKRRKPGMSAIELEALHRTNLAHLMIADVAKIDELAVYLQSSNTRRARFNSPQFARNTMVLEAVASLALPIQVLYGDLDGPALPDVAGKERLFLEANPHVQFCLVPGSGHWLAYEQPEEFEQRLNTFIRQVTPEG